MRNSSDQSLAEFTLEDGTTFLVEVPLPKDPTIQKVSRGGRTIAKAKQSLDVLLEKVNPVASTVLSKLRGLNTPADEVEVKFGLQLSADAGVVFASAGSDVTFEITLKWQNPNNSPDTPLTADESVADESL